MAMNPLAIMKLVLLLALVGFLVYLIVTYVPMPAIFKQVITVFVAVALIIWLISVFLGGGTHLLSLG